MVSLYTVLKRFVLEFYWNSLRRLFKLMLARWRSHPIKYQVGKRQPTNVCPWLIGVCLVLVLSLIVLVSILSFSTEHTVCSIMFGRHLYWSYLVHFPIMLYFRSYLSVIKLLGKRPRSRTTVEIQQRFLESNWWREYWEYSFDFENSERKFKVQEMFQCSKVILAFMKSKHSQINTLDFSSQSSPIKRLNIFEGHIFSFQLNFEDI